MLEVTGLVAGYGDLRVLHDVTFRVGDGEIVALVGANGAGKTTLVRTICGLLEPSAGQVRKDAADLTSMPAHRRVARGIAVVLEGRRLWGELTVQENLRLAEVNGRRRATKRFSMEEVTRLFPVIAARYHTPVEFLSGGEQQMVAIARALLMQPDLLVMDEPSTGLAPKVVKEIFSVLGNLRSSGVSLLVVEQNVALVAGIADRGYVMSLGRLVHEIVQGEWSTTGSDDALAKAYLGA